MADRVRPPGAAPGANVTDETYANALGACIATSKRVQDTADEAKTARSEHSAELKKWKKLGVDIEALKNVIKERFEDPGDTLARVHAECRLRAISGKMPSIQQDLMSLWQPIDLEADKQAEINRQRWRDEGSFAGREGVRRDANPYHQAEQSEAYAAWDKGWLEDQTRIAKEMAAGDQPAVDTSRQRPARKAAANGEASPQHEPEVEAAMKPAGRKAAAKKEAAPKKRGRPPRGGDAAPAVH